MSILSLLEQIEFGHFAEELNTVQQEVVQAVRDTNKKGSITISLEFNPENHGQMTIKADFKKKVPELPRGSSLFFSTPEGRLQRDDPRQQKLELKTLEPISAELKSVK